MSELGSGLNSSYPLTKDTDNTKEVADTTLATAEWANDVADAIIQMQNAIGSNVSGSLVNTAGKVITDLFNSTYVVPISPLDIISKGPILDVRAFGVTGDGVTDDTVNIQAAFDSIGATGGVRKIYFPSGVYMVSANININKNNILIFGNGISTVIKTVNAATNFTANFVIATGMQYVTIKNISIDGNAINNSTNLTAAIYAVNTHNLIIEDNYISNTPQNGIYLSATNLAHTDFRIQRNKLTDIGWRAIQVHKGQLGFINDNIVISSGNHGIGVTTGTSAVSDASVQVNISNNIITRAVPPTVILTGQVEGGFLILLGEGSHDCTISNNICYDNRNANQDGIGTVGSPGDTAVIYRAISIIGNLVTYAGAFGIDATSLCTVIGNVIDRPGTDGIIIAGDLEPLRKDIIISNNVIYNPNERNIAGTAGIALNVQNNPGIGPFTWKRIKISDNIVVDERGVKQVAYGILINATNMLINGLDIYNNNIVNVLTESIHITNPSNVSNMHVYRNNEILTFKSLDLTATPSVLGFEQYTIAGGGATITNLINGHTGQKVFIQFAGITTVDFTGNANMKGNGGVDFTSASKDFMECVSFNGQWHCSIHLS